MTNLGEALSRTCSALSEAGVPFALIGGLAVSARTEPRFTRDIDLAVAIPAVAADALGRTLLAHGFFIDTVLAAHADGQVAGLRLFVGQVRVDLLLSVTGLEAEACACAEVLELVPGIHVPVVTLPYLLLFKLVAVVNRRRLQDEADIETMLAYAQPAERQQVPAMIGRLAGAYRTDAEAARKHWLRLSGDPSTGV